MLPGDVPEVAAGLWWDPEDHEDLGQATFHMNEQNGNTTFDLIQATLTRQPSVATNNGFDQWFYNQVDTQFVATAFVTWPWATSIYIAFWVYFDTTVGNRTIFIHGNTSPDLHIYVASHSTQGLNWQVSTDGSTYNVFRYSDFTTLTGEWHFIECWYEHDVVDPTDSMHMAIDLVEVAPDVGPSVSGVLNNTSDNFWAPNTGVDFEIGMMYCANGIPADTHRVGIYNYKAPR